MRKNVFFYILAVSVFVLSYTPEKPAYSAEVSVENAAGVLRMGVHVSDMGKLDPHFAAGSQDRAFADMVFNGLLRYKPGEAPEIEPDLAVVMPEFEIINDKQVWTIALKKGVMFHPAPGLNSYEMTADDVVFSLQKAADARFSAYAGSYSNWEVSKIDKYTIRIVLAEPVSSVVFFPKLTNYAGGFIVSKNAIESKGYEEFKKHPVGTGPFKFDSYSSGKQLTLRAHETYFRGKPLLDGVEMHFYPKLDEREKRFVAGELHVIYGSGEKGWIEKMEGLKDVIIDTFGVGEVATVYFNITSEPLNDIRVRKAIAYALNRKAFVETTAARVAGEVFSPVPAMFLPGGLTGEEAEKLKLTYPENLSEARKLLAEAGYENGFTLDLVSSEKRIYKSLYRVLQEELSQIGIVCNVEEVKHSEMHRIIRNEPKPLVIYAAWRPNADSYLTRFFHSSSIVKTGEKPDTNFSHYRAIDRLIEDARKEIFPNRLVSLWKQAQIRILSDVAAYPLMFTRQLYARKSNVEYGHLLVSTMALYPQITEKTHL